ncbi:MAG: TPM domain-containing protein [Methylobacter sp.]|nr:TPM domain-containing protein [Methylobacter sp.]MDP2430122.1 TPM domain-containing protein [Methylobacter sp.]MDP3054263.1 TPM domain-containing protein [Methylobacter sp.]MDP3363725.1 TPM domain-containing protein [Methylobacter sp.]MDZ4220813.1 TPM domain-containing protein [Methylobacter sp.]
MVTILRCLRHAFMPPWRWRLLFPQKTLNEIEKAIERSELQHGGELRFAVENALAPGQVWRGFSARQRAEQLFSELRVWDTEHNSGVLIYLSLADREVHIIADRGISALVAQAEWEAITQTMQHAFQRGDFLYGSLQGIERITALLAAYFPPGAPQRNELCNKPVIVKN